MSLKEKYEELCQTGPGYQQLLPTVNQIAKTCSSVVEIGVLELNSTFSILEGLSQSPHPVRSFLAIDVTLPPENLLQKAKLWAQEANIDFRFMKANDLEVRFDFTFDFLHIDSTHTYRHLLYELETFSPSVRTFILMHDTSEPWGYSDESQNFYDWPYPPHIDRNKRGLWPAVADFLRTHPEWELYKRLMPSPGLTIIRRKEDAGHQT